MKIPGVRLKNKFRKSSVQKRHPNSDAAAYLYHAIIYANHVNDFLSDERVEVDVESLKKCITQLERTINCIDRALEEIGYSRKELHNILAHQ